MTNTERIAEIEKRCEAATPGPWKHGNGSTVFQGRCFIKCGDKLIIGLDGGLRENNADFIAHARDDIPYLLEENARLAAELNHKQSELEHLAKEMARLVTEGVEREKKLTELEAEVAAIARPNQDGGAKIAYDENHVPYLAEFEGSEAAHVIELLNAEVDGRLVVLPCPVGTQVYRVYNTRGCDNCTKFNTSCNGNDCPALKILPKKFRYEHLSIMQDVKLTRAEAEAVLSAEGVE